MKQICLHPLPLRIWHWLNALIVIVLIATGLYMRLRGVASLNPHDPVLLWHKLAGIAMMVATAFWLIYTISSEDLRRRLKIKKSDLKGAYPQARYYLFSMFKGEENPFQASAAEKYNSLQKMAYGAVMFVFIPVLTFTGLPFMDIPLLRDYFLSAKLVGPLGALHVLFAYLFVLYLIFHLYMATLGETFFSHTQAMIVGYEEQGRGVKEEEAGPA